MDPGALPTSPSSALRPRRCRPMRERRPVRRQDRDPRPRGQRARTPAASRSQFRPGTSKNATPRRRRQSQCAGRARRSSGRNTLVSDIARAPVADAHSASRPGGQGDRGGDHHGDHLRRAPWPSRRTSRGQRCPNMVGPRILVAVHAAGRSTRTLKRCRPGRSPAVAAGGRATARAPPSGARHQALKIRYMTVRSSAYIPVAESTKVITSTRIVTQDWRRFQPGNASAGRKTPAPLHCPYAGTQLARSAHGHRCRLAGGCDRANGKGDRDQTTRPGSAVDGGGAAALIPDPFNRVPARSLTMLPLPISTHHITPGLPRHPTVDRSRPEDTGRRRTGLTEVELRRRRSLQQGETPRMAKLRRSGSGSPGPDPHQCHDAGRHSTPGRTSAAGQAAAASAVSAVSRAISFPMMNAQWRRA